MTYLFSLLLILAPLYVWRFSIGGLPTNFLMLANFAVIGLGILSVLRDDSWSKIKESIASLGRPMLLAIGLFGLSSFISLVAFGINAEKLAQWVVLYAQPLVLFVLFRYFYLANSKAAEYFKIAAYIVVGAAGTLAVVQYFTLATLPEQWWGNANEPKRAISFFAHANAFGLFITPLLAWLIPDVVAKFRGNAAAAETAVKNIANKYIYAAAWLLGAAGILLSLSRGAWLGLAVAAGLYALVSANKKMIIGFIIAGLVLAGIVAAVPNLRYRVLLPFYGEKSAVARLSLWDTGMEMIKDNPLLGKGVNGFSDNWEKYNKDPNLEHYNFPHNIFLNFWIDLGLLGALSMAAVMALAAARGIVRRANPLALGAMLMVAAIAAHGLIDIPYLKNDLALAFWLILAISL